MKSRIKYLLLTIISLIGTSCEDKDDPTQTSDSQRILDCHNKQTWGFDATKNRVIGLWEWKHVEYIYAVPPYNDSELKGMKIEFRDDLTGTLTYNEVAPLEFTWSIGTYNIYFSLSTEPVITHVNGVVLFCDDIMSCGITGSGIADGVNNYFERIE